MEFSEKNSEKRTQKQTLKGHLAFVAFKTKNVHAKNHGNVSLSVKL